MSNCDSNEGTLEKLTYLSLNLNERLDLFQIFVQGFRGDFSKISLKEKNNCYL